MIVIGGQTTTTTTTTYQVIIDWINKLIVLLKGYVLFFPTPYTTNIPNSASSLEKKLI